jgi:hypothetical protein
MPTTVCLYLRGDGATRALEAFRRALGTEAEAFEVHPNRDDSGYYGSADVTNVEAAREAFSAARQPFPALKAYFGILPADREEGAPRGGHGRSGDGRSRQSEQRSSSIRPAMGKPIADGASASRGQERPRQAHADDQSGEQGGRKPLRFRNRNDRRKQSDRDPQA